MAVVVVAGTGLLDAMRCWYSRKLNNYVPFHAYPSTSRSRHGGPTARECYLGLEVQQ